MPRPNAQGQQHDGMEQLLLHRLLRSRLGDAYVPAQQLGGALYYFLRGIDGVTQGMQVLPQSADLLRLLDALERLFEEGSQCPT